VFVLLCNTLFVFPIISSTPIKKICLDDKPENLLRYDRHRLFIIKENIIDATQHNNTLKIAFIY
jgi:hypothetical protein